MFKVEAKRRKLGISYELIAKEMGVTRQAILAIATGKNDPSFKLAIKLANYFNMPVEELFSEIEEEKDTSQTELLTGKEVSTHIFNNKISYAQIMGMAHRGEIPFLKIGSKYFFTKQSISEFIQRNMQPICNISSKTKANIATIAGISKID